MKKVSFILLGLFLIGIPAEAGYLSAEIGGAWFVSSWRNENAFTVAVDGDLFDYDETYEKPGSGFAVDLGLWYDTEKLFAFGMNYFQGRHMTLFQLDPFGGHLVDPELTRTGSLGVRYYPQTMRSPVALFPYFQLGTSVTQTGWRVPKQNVYLGDIPEERLRAYDANLTQWHANIGLGLHFGKRDETHALISWLFSFPLATGENAFSINRLQLTYGF